MHHEKQGRVWLFLNAPSLFECISYILYTLGMSFSDAEKVLIDQDPILGTLIRSQHTITLRPERDYFEALASSIVSQQISVKAAASIFARFKGNTDLKPEQVALLDDEQTKAIGLSAQKTKYLKDLANHFVQDSAVFNHLDGLSDDEVIAELTRVKGIGVWTAQMFLIFTLHRPDVFAPDDRGLQLAIQKLYKFSKLPGRAELEEFATRWTPYRSTACLHLWRSLDNEPK